MIVCCLKLERVWLLHRVVDLLVSWGVFVIQVRWYWAVEWISLLLIFIINCHLINYIPFQLLVVRQHPFSFCPKTKFGHFSIKSSNDLRSNFRWFSSTDCLICLTSCLWMTSNLRQLVTSLVTQLCQLKFVNFKSQLISSTY